MSIVIIHKIDFICWLVWMLAEVTERRQDQVQTAIRRDVVHEANRKIALVFDELQRNEWKPHKISRERNYQLECVQQNDDNLEGLRVENELKSRKSYKVAKVIYAEENSKRTEPGNFLLELRKKSNGCEVTVHDDVRGWVD